MTRYLVVAHQTATEPHLLARVRGLGADDPGVTFTLLIPATRVEHLMTWQSGESEAIARARGEAARSAFEAVGVTVAGVTVGDELPIWAIEDELRARPEAYDAVILSTLPPGRSRWVETYSHARAEERLGLPIIHVYEGAERYLPEGRAAPSVERAPLVVRALNWLTEPAAGRGGLTSRRTYVALVALMLTYLGVTATLALTVNYRFFLNDTLAILVFGGLIAALIWNDRRARA